MADITAPSSMWTTKVALSSSTTLAMVNAAMKDAASSQWKSRVGRSQTRMRFMVRFHLSRLRV